PVFLVARGEVQDRTDARIEPLAVGKLAASFGIWPAWHEPLALVEEGVGSRRVVSPRRRRRAGNDAQHSQEAKTTDDALRSTACSGMGRHPHCILLLYPPAPNRAE